MHRHGQADAEPLYLCTQKEMAKPNPSIAGTSRYPHSPQWLAVEVEILEWWETVRDELRVPIPFNINDSPLLHYEKELLQWWETVRGDYGYV